MKRIKVHQIGKGNFGNKISEGALEFAYQGPLIELMGETVLVAISGKVNFNIIILNSCLVLYIINVNKVYFTIFL